MNTFLWFMGSMVVVDAVVWVLMYKRERRDWGRSLAIIAGNVSVACVNTAIICILVVATIVGLY